MNHLIGTPEDLAERMVGSGLGPACVAMRKILAEGIRARDDQIADALADLRRRLSDLEAENATMRDQIRAGKDVM